MKKNFHYLSLCFLFLTMISCASAENASTPNSLESKTAQETPSTTEVAVSPTILSDSSIFIITGGPGSGKTTVLNALREKKFVCFDEAARQIIQDQMGLEGEGVPWKNLDLFNTLVLDRMLEKLHTKQTFYGNQITFFDRGIPDIIAYLNNDNRPILPLFKNAVAKFRYNKAVFMAPPWEAIYKNDTERKESFEQAIKIYEELRKSYIDAGYTIYELPKTSVKDRVDFIMKVVKKNRQ